VWKIKVPALFVVLGLALGFGAGLFMGAGGAPSQRAIVAAYQSTLADWQRRANDLDRELATARAYVDEHKRLDDERGKLDAEIRGIIEKGKRESDAAIGEYNKTLANLRVVERVYSALRKYYEQPARDTKIPDG
jgi:hypothetical protein